LACPRRQGKYWLVISKNTADGRLFQSKCLMSTDGRDILGTYAAFIGRWIWQMAEQCNSFGDNQVIAYFKKHDYKILGHKHPE